MKPEVYFDDYRPGQVFRTGGYTFTEGQILEFAFKYDPQPFHIDAEAAKSSIFSGLVASGFHTMVIVFRLWHAENIFPTASMGGHGMDGARWLKPVYAGDTLTAEVEVIELKPSTTRTDRGYATFEYRGVNQHGETVLVYRLQHILRRRSQEATVG